MLPIVMLLLTCFTPSARGQPHRIHWTEGPRLPSGLAGHVAAVVDDKIIVAGGTSWIEKKKYWRDEIWKLDETEQNWRAWGKLRVGLAHGAWAVDGEALLLLGGWTEAGATDQVFRCTNGEVTVQPHSKLPDPRAMTAGGAADRAVYVIGGLRDPTDFTIALRTVLRHDPAAPDESWRPAAPLPRAVALAASVSAGGKIFVFGGIGPAEGKTMDSADAFSYDPRQDRWERLPPLPSPRRGAVGVAIDARYILVIGGCRGEKNGLLMLDEVLAYDTRENRYHPCTPLPFAALCQQAVVKGGRIYVIGGEDRPRHRTDRVAIGRVLTTEK